MQDEVNLFVGRRIRRRRRLLDMTQQQLGAACGVTFQQIQKYESACTRLSIDTLWRIARALEVDIGYFFEGLGDAQGDSRAPLTRQPDLVSV